MAKRLALAILLVFSLVITPGVAQQRPTDGLVVSGSIVDADSGAIVGGAEVRLVRKAALPKTGYFSYNSLSTGRTDSAGHFSFGRVSLRSTQVDFPFESSVSLDYAVTKDRQVLNVRRVEFVTDAVRYTQPDDTLGGLVGNVTVKLFVSTPTN